MRFLCGCCGFDFLVLFRIIFVWRNGVPNLRAVLILCCSSDWFFDFDFRLVFWVLCRFIRS